MKTQTNRVKQLERKTPTEEQRFHCWMGNPWTPEQEAEALRRNPERRVFWRSLLETPENKKREMADPSAVL